MPTHIAYCSSMAFTYTLEKLRLKHFLGPPYKTIGHCRKKIIVEIKKYIIEIIRTEFSK